MTDTEGSVFHEVAVIEGSARRRSWSTEEKVRIVSESLDPAVSVSAVARRHGLNPNQLFTWRRQFRNQMEPWLAEEQEEMPAAASVPSGTIEVLFDGVTVRVATGVDAATLRRVLTVLRGLR